MDYFQYRDVFPKIGSANLESDGLDYLANLCKQQKPSVLKCRLKCLPHIFLDNTQENSWLNVSTLKKIALAAHIMLKQFLLDL